MKPILRIFVAAALALALLVTYNQQRIDSANLALGTENQSAYEIWNQQRITAASPADIAELVEGRAKTAEVANSQTTSIGNVIWLGNSQLHTINQFRSGDHLAPFWVAQYSTSWVSLGISLPNANVQEHLVLAHFILGQLPVNLVILKLVFDDMREDGLRAELSPLMNANVRERLATTAIGREILAAEHASHKTSISEEKTAGLHGFAQEYFEDRLVENLGAIWPLWADRANLRNRVMVDLYEFRNWVFGIKPSSVRPMIQPRYERNMAAFETLAIQLRDAGIPLLVYIAPIRYDVKLPYELSSYQAWIGKIGEMSSTYGYRFINLERLIPNNLWGSIRNDDIDFMHFKGPGHKILADRLRSEIENAVANRQPVKANMAKRP